MLKKSFEKFREMRKSKKIISVSVIIVALTLSYMLVFNNVVGSGENAIMSTIKRGDFQIEIITTGELEAKNSVDIMGPRKLRDARIWRVTIEDILNEGTVVDKGDYVATFDNSEIKERINQQLITVEEELAAYTQVQLDTALELTKARDEVTNKTYAVRKKELELKQSEFEPPALVEMLKMELDEALRNLEQSRMNYRLVKQKCNTNMRNRTKKLNEEQERLSFFIELEKEFIIHAPEPGMVIYRRDRSGRRIGKDYELSTYYPAVATLPDLTKMISRTYVNEVDIRQIQPNQSVKIGLDAFPEKRLNGKVVRVANVGEQKPNSDAKVFEVEIEIGQSDTTLRPAMTTSNNILAELIPDVLYAPLDAIHSLGDTLTFVYLNKGLQVIRKEIEMGAVNSNEAVVKNGLQEGDVIFLSVPKDADKAKIVRLHEEIEEEEPQLSFSERIRSRFRGQNRL
ncbi:MAG: HlyD family efflux transporter periplasmic adaptor subunit [Cyclobacteriaceae bacterium]|nr:HlyD family efflux transporter periplasmic adaptor subunit [Cyclobacteriaceae bacterium]